MLRVCRVRDSFRKFLEVFVGNVFIAFNKFIGPRGLASANLLEFSLEVRVQVDGSAV